MSAGTWRAAGVALFLVLLASRAEAGAGSATVSFTPMELRSWKLEDAGGPTQVRQWTAPLLLQFQARESFSLRLALDGGRATLEDPASSIDVDAFSCARLSGDWRSEDGQVRVIAGFSLPAGRRLLSPEQRVVSRFIALPVLGFGMRELGHGGELIMGGSCSRQVGERGVVSLGAGTTIRAAYKWQQGQEDLQPASDAAITTGIDLLGHAGGLNPGIRPLSLDVTYRFFGSDRLGASKVFEEGGQWEGHAEYRFSPRGIDQSLDLRGIRKGLSQQTSLATSGTPDLAWRTGDCIAAAWQGSHVVRSSLLAGWRLDYADYSGSDVRSRTGHSLGAGAWIELRTQTEARLRLATSRLRGELGSGTDTTVKLSGYSISIGLSYVRER